MVNRILFKYKFFSEKVNNFSFNLCVLDNRKDSVFLLANPKLVYAIIPGNNNRKKIVKDIILTSINQVEQDSLINFPNKIDKKNKINTRTDDNLEINKKNKIKSRKKARNQINLNNDEIFINDTNFSTQNVQSKDDLNISTNKPVKISKNKKKFKVKQDNNDINIDHISDISKENRLNKEIVLDAPLTIQQLSDKLGVPEAAIITWLFLKRISVTINQVVDISIATEVAKHYNFTILDKLNSQDLINGASDANKMHINKGINRSPIITIFGHVDHGKTTLLDFIRKTNLAESEVGGITQSITGHEVEFEYLSSKEKLVFLDTPGHEAFAGMRLRGAEVTDLAILVVAADDGLKPQTIEAIKHILNRKIPYVIALNKIDKKDKDIDLDKIKKQLANYNMLDKRWGGESEIIEVSALTGQNIDLLLFALCKLSKSQNLQADPLSFAQGTILEAHLDKKTGPVANVVVQNGTLHIGNIVVAGNIYGRIKAIINSSGKKIDKAEPSAIVEIWGFSSMPQAGLKFQVVQDEKNAKLIIGENLRNNNISSISNLLNSRVTLDSYNNASNLKIVNIILKADTQGSIEAIINAFAQIPQEKVQINILSASSGSISNKDTELAMTSQSIILGFNIGINSNVRNTADRSGIIINVFNIIYSLVDYIKEYMLSLVDPEYNRIPIGKATVQTVFNINKGVVAGCLVNSGKLKKNANISVYRNKDLLYSGLIDSLKRVKDDVEEVVAGNECGVMCSNYNLWYNADIIEAYELLEKPKIL